MPNVIIPEVVKPLPRELEALQRFARLMDEAVAIPGTNRRIGLDAGLGLIPVVGDVVAALMSTWIVIGALRWRVPRWRVANMVFLVLADLAFGALPIVGDVFDWLFESNMMNMNSLIRHFDATQPPRSTREVAGSALLVIFIIGGGAMLLLVFGVIAIWSLITALIHRF